MEIIPPTVLCVCSYCAACCLFPAWTCVESSGDISIGMHHAVVFHVKSSRHPLCTAGYTRLLQKPVLIVELFASFQRAAPLIQLTLNSLFHTHQLQHMIIKRLKRFFTHRLRIMHTYITYLHL